MYCRIKVTLSLCKLLKPREARIALMADEITRPCKASDLVWITLGFVTFGEVKVLFGLEGIKFF